MIGKNGKTAVLPGFNEDRMQRWQWWRAGDVAATMGVMPGRPGLAGLVFILHTF